MAYTQRVYLNSTEKIDFFAITHDVKRAVSDSAVSQGLVTITVPLGDGGVGLLENDPEIRDSLRNLLLQLVPDRAGKRPDRHSKSGAVEAHLRAFLIGQSLTLSIIDGQLAIGHWQDVMVYDFDHRITRRECVIHVIGEGKEEAPQQRGRGGAAGVPRRPAGGKSLPPGKARMA